MDDDDDDDDDDDEHERDDVTHEPSWEDRPTTPTTHPGGVDRRGQRPRNKLLAEIDTAAIAKSGIDVEKKPH
jgi:hypothetical protein